jgi:hypothetical protein
LYEGPGFRESGNATLYVSNPWQDAALATIGNLEIFCITDPYVVRNPPALTLMNPLGINYYDKFNIPYNYRITFDITPRGKLSDWGSIIHFTDSGADNDTPGNRMPAIWTNKNSYLLYVRTGTVGQKDVGFSSWTPLVENVVNKVTLEAFGTNVVVYKHYFCWIY